MNSQPPPIPRQLDVKNGFSAKHVVVAILFSVVISIVTTIVAIKLLLFPGPFKPVVLSVKEEKALETKLDSITARKENRFATSTPARVELTPATPEKYSEKDASRDIHFTERELNAIIAKNTGFAEKMAIDLADDTVSIKLLIPLDQNFPFFGGQTLRVTAGTELAHRNGRPVVKLQGVSFMGVPMPNSWLGGLKNVDLVAEYGGNNGFWKGFADGVAAISVQDGSLAVRLKE